MNCEIYNLLGVASPFSRISIQNTYIFPLEQTETLETSVYIKDFDKSPT